MSGLRFWCRMGGDVDFTGVRRSLRPKMVSYWEFNNSVADTARAGATFTTGTPTYTTGPGGVANDALASAVSGDITVSTTKGMSAVHTGGSFSMGGFFRCTTSNNSVFRYRNGASTIITWSLFKSAGASEGWSLRLGIQGVGDVESYSGNSSSDWVHYVATVSNGTVSHYINGSLVSTDSVTVGAMAVPTTGDRYSVFRTGVECSRLFFAHDALTAAEVAYLYNGGSGRAASDFMTVTYGTTADTYLDTLVASGDGLWKLNATSGTSATNSAPGALGALTGTNGAAMGTAQTPPSGYSASDGVGSTDGTNDFWLVPNIDTSSGSTSYAHIGEVYPDALNTTERLWSLGTSNSTDANAQVVSIRSTGASILSCYYYNTAITQFVEAQSETGCLTTGAWQQVGAAYNDTTRVLYAVHNGISAGANVGSFSPPSVLRNQNAIAARRNASLALDAKQSRHLLTTAHTPTLPQLAKWYDLSILNSG